MAFPGHWHNARMPAVRSFALPLIVAFVAAIAAAATVLLWPAPEHASSRDSNTAVNADRGLVATVLPRPRSLPAVTLTAPDGRRWTTSDLSGNWHFLFFGFTHCPDVCPMTLADLAGTLQRLADNGTRPLPGVVFVSVDPGRDTPERLGDYVSHFHDDVVGLTGERDAIDTLTSALGISYTLHAPDANGDYAVDHSAAILLLDPEGRLRALWQPPHGREVLAEEFRQIQQRHGGET